MSYTAYLKTRKSISHDTYHLHAGGCIGYQDICVSPIAQMKKKKSDDEKRMRFLANVFTLEFNF
ncbi:unnamed protein product [Rhodiola kirilowii]